MGIEIVDLPIKNCGFPYFFVGLPGRVFTKDIKEIPNQMVAEKKPNWPTGSKSSLDPP